MKNTKLALIISAAVLIIAATTAAYFLISSAEGGSFAEVYCDGELICRQSLSENKRIETAGNTIITEDGTASVIAADCPDKLCIKQGRISKKGQIVVCLPNKIIVKIV